MQYQEVLLLLNIAILIMVYFFCKENSKQLKVMVAAILYAYLLAAPLPRLLILIPLKWIALFYGIEIGLAFIVTYLILYDHPHFNIVKARKRMQSNNSYIDESESNTEKDTCEIVSAETHSESNTTADRNEITKPAAAEDLAAQETPEDVDKAAVGPDDVKEPTAPQNQANMGTEDPADDNALSSGDDANMDFNKSEEPEIADNMPTPVNLTTHSETSNIEESSNDEQLDIEQLINQAFDAKCRDDYRSAIYTFEQILGQSPPEEMAALIADDIEVMRRKIS